MEDWALPGKYSPPQSKMCHNVHTVSTVRMIIYVRAVPEPICNAQTANPPSASPHPDSIAAEPAPKQVNTVTVRGLDSVPCRERQTSTSSPSTTM